MNDKAQQFYQNWKSCLKKTVKTSTLLKLHEYLKQILNNDDLRWSNPQTQVYLSLAFSVLENEEINELIKWKKCLDIDLLAKLQAEYNALRAQKTALQEKTGKLEEKRGKLEAEKGKLEAELKLLKYEKNFSKDEAAYIEEIKEIDSQLQKLDDLEHQIQIPQKIEGLFDKPTTFSPIFINLEDEGETKIHQGKPTNPILFTKPDNFTHIQNLNQNLEDKGEEEKIQKNVIDVSKPLEIDKVPFIDDDLPPSEYRPKNINELDQKQIDKEINKLESLLNDKNHQIDIVKNIKGHELKNVAEKFFQFATDFLSNNSMLIHLYFFVIRLELKKKTKIKDSHLKEKIKDILHNLSQDIQSKIFVVETPATVYGFTSNEPLIFLKYDYLDFNWIDNNDYLIAALIISLIHELIHYLRRELVKIFPDEFEENTPKVQFAKSKKKKIDQSLQNNFWNPEAGKRVETLLFGEYVIYLYDDEIHDLITLNDKQIKNQTFQTFRKNFQKKRAGLKSNPNKNPIKFSEAKQKGTFYLGNCGIALIRRII